MNEAQRVWWRQAQADHTLFVQLRSRGAPECHMLHFLQMTTEKLSKAYFWRSGTAPPKTHAGFGRFLKALLDRPSAELDQIALVLDFARRRDLESWVRSVQPLAYALEQMAPAEAGDGPNPEYPWPHMTPTECPIDYTFPLWRQLTEMGQGRKLLEIVKRSVERFEQYA
jgi:hypothetical protein